MVKRLIEISESPIFNPIISHCPKTGQEVVWLPHETDPDSDYKGRVEYRCSYSEYSHCRICVSNKFFRTKKSSSKS